MKTMSRRVVPVLLAFAALAATDAIGGSCVSFMSPQPQFVAYVNQKVNLQVHVIACGSAGSVVITPDSETNNKISLTNQGSGLWGGTWIPGVANASVRLGAFVFDANGDITSVGGSPTIGIVSGSVQPPPPSVTLAPGTITFAVAAGGPLAAQTLTIANNDSQPHVVSAQASGDAWLSLSSAGGTIQPQSTLAVPVLVDPSSLSSGSYNGSVAVTSDGQPAGVALINVTVSPPSAPIQITASLNTLTFQLDASDLSSSQSVTLTNSNGVAVNVAAQSSAPWMTVAPANFTIAANSTQTLTVTAFPVEMPLAGIISIQPAGGQLVQIAASLTVQAPPANLTVSPASLAVTSTTGGLPQTLIVNLQNPGLVSAPFAVMLPNSAPWLLNVAPSVGTVPPSITTSAGQVPGLVALEIAVDPSKLAVGSYSATFTIALRTARAPRNPSRPTKFFTVEELVKVMACGRRFLLANAACNRFADDCGATVSYASTTSTSAPALRSSRGITSRATLARTSRTRFPFTRRWSAATTDSAMYSFGVIVTFSPCSSMAFLVAGPMAAIFRWANARVLIFFFAMRSNKASTPFTLVRTNQS
jgi:hypothetical protein